MSDYHDYKENLAFPPIGSQDDLNEQGRQSDVLIKAIEKCEKLEKENQQLKELLKEIRSLWKGTICMPDSQEQVRDILTKIDNVIGEK